VIWNGGEYSNTVMGESLFDVASQALEFFCGPNWKGPRPRRDTVLDVPRRLVASRMLFCSVQQGLRRYVVIQRMNAAFLAGC
jgi:hypothetical protein